MDPVQKVLFKAPRSLEIGSKSSILEDVIERLRPIDHNIQTWAKIALNEKIDIKQESKNYISLLNACDTGETKEIKEFWKQFAKENFLIIQKKSESSIFEKKLDPVKLLLIEGCKLRIQKRIFNKVKTHLQRIPPARVLQSLKAELKSLTMLWSCPWIKIAKNEGVNTDEEFQILSKAQLSTIEKRKENNVHPENILEIALRRLIFLHRECTLKIITKVYANRIAVETDKAKRRILLGDHELVIDGIAKEFLNVLPSGKNLGTVLDKCHKNFNKFKQNLFLLEKYPKAYFFLADREWLKRKIEKRFKMLLQNANNQKQILACKVIVLQIVESNQPINLLINKVNSAFKSLGERLFSDKIGGCGYNEINLTRKK